MRSPGLGKSKTSRRLYLHTGQTNDLTAQQAAWSGRGMARPVCISTSMAPRRSGRAFGAMKRLCAYNSLVALAFVLLWALLVVVEVKVRLFWFLSYIFFGSLPMVFVSFFLASWRALRPTSEHPVGIAGLLSVVMTPIFVIVGVMLVTNFKFMIGGHL